ncbi:MAG: aldehyde dehydrogenase family protein [Flavobacteriales bacterium]|nr:aldehyde dehydrogenase family protein [Flavobacteriales bacterium]
MAEVKDLKKKVASTANGRNGAKKQERLEVLKTYKLYIDGKFPRTESGRYYKLPVENGKKVANVCLGSRKDFRNAVVAARKAFESWSGRSAFNRGQIVYRIAEMLETRKSQFIEELVLQGLTVTQAKVEVVQSIDRIIYYAGWADKYQQIFSSVNPVSSPHFNFSSPEPVGVVSIMAPSESGLLGFISNVIPAIVGGNTVVVVSSEKWPLSAITFAEVLNSSDVPAGVVNIITGKEEELYSHIAKHLDVNALIYSGGNSDTLKAIQELAIGNVKRIINRVGYNWKDSKNQNPYLINDTQEVKTTWHPIEQIGGASAKY